jgi:hypothetical protein
LGVIGGTIASSDYRLKARQKIQTKTGIISVYIANLSDFKLSVVVPFSFWETFPPIIELSFIY